MNGPDLKYTLTTKLVKNFYRNLNPKYPNLSESSIQTFKNQTFPFPPQSPTNSQLSKPNPPKNATKLPEMRSRAQKTLPEQQISLIDAPVADRSLRNRWGRERRRCIRLRCRLRSPLRFSILESTDQRLSLYAPSSTPILRSSRAEKEEKTFL